MDIKGKIKRTEDVKGRLSLPELIVGKSAYDIAVENGFEGDEQTWLESLKGEKPIKFIDYLTPEDIDIIDKEIKPVKTVNNVAPDENGNIELKGSGGADGLTPYIKDGNWWIGETDTGVKAEGKDGEKGDKGDKGDKGEQGIQGKKGDPYTLTEADKQEIIDSIRVIYPEAHVIYGDVTEDNTIIIHGTLPAGEYTLKYEGEDGISTGITTIEVRAKTYTNALPLAIDSDGTPYNGGKGYKQGYRLNSSALEVKQDDMSVAGFIKVSRGDTIYLDGITMNPNDANSFYIYLYKSSFETNGAYFRSDVSMDYALENGGVVLGDNGSIVQMKLDGSLFSNWDDFDNTQTTYLRFSAQEINDNSIVSINKPIV